MGTQERCIKLLLGIEAEFQEITGELSEKGGMRMRRVKTLEGAFQAYGGPKGMAKSRLPTGNHRLCGSVGGDGESDQEEGVSSQPCLVSNLDLLTLWVARLH